MNSSHCHIHSSFFYLMLPSSLLSRISFSSSPLPSRFERLISHRYTYFFTGFSTSHSLHIDFFFLTFLVLQPGPICPNRPSLVSSLFSTSFSVGTLRVFLSLRGVCFSLCGFSRPELVCEEHPHALQTLPSLSLSRRRDTSTPFFLPFFPICICP